ncbi:MAG: hypothetical protein JW717_05115 [Marinilabiliaceae bacterium]|nr:hypothetical protein [Marinilabiliaceae bacterium]
MKRLIFILILFSLLTAISLFAKGKELLIIYDSGRFGDGIEFYKMWKSLLGFDVTLKDVEDWTNPDSSDIFNYIHNTWYPGKDHYVLLLGKVSEVPSNKHQGINDEYPCYSDWYYNSHTFYTDDTKIHLITGRIICDEAETFSTLKKILEYEFIPVSYDPLKITTCSIRGTDENVFIDGARYHYMAFEDEVGWSADSAFAMYSPVSSWDEDDFESHWADKAIIFWEGHGNVNEWNFVYESPWTN